MQDDVISAFCEFYRCLSLQDIEKLDSIYSPAIEFTDPVHRVSGLDSLEIYFRALCQDNIDYTFDIHEVLIDSHQGKAFLRWTMHYQHPKLASNQPLSLKGGTFLRFNDLIDYHEDYYDMGAMIYEHVPVIGWAVRSIKRRLGG